MTFLSTGWQSYTKNFANPHSVDSINKPSLVYSCILRLILFFAMLSSNKEFKSQADVEFISRTQNRTIVSFEGEVFDLSSFVAKHPGGSSIILEWKGKCVDNVLFNPSHFIHSRNILRKLAFYKIGFISKTISALPLQPQIEKPKHVIHSKQQSEKLPSKLSSIQQNIAKDLSVNSGQMKKIPENQLARKQLKSSNHKNCSNKYEGEEIATNSLENKIVLPSKTNQTQENTDNGMLQYQTETTGRTHKISSNQIFPEILRQEICQNENQELHQVPNLTIDTAKEIINTNNLDTNQNCTTKDFSQQEQSNQVLNETPDLNIPITTLQASHILVKRTSGFSECDVGEDYNNENQRYSEVPLLPFTQFPLRVPFF